MTKPRPLGRHARRLTLAVLLAGCAIAPAAAQTASGDVVVMRRTVTPPNIQAAPSRSGHWSVGTPVATPGCSASQPTTAPVTCVDSTGSTVSDNQCVSAGDKPDGKGTAADYSMCGYTWAEGGWSPYSSQCAQTATRDQTVSCRRSDGTTVPDAQCPGTKPNTHEIADITAGCTYTWAIDDWLPWSSTCSDTSTRTRRVSCYQSDTRTATNATCVAKLGAMPTETDGPTPVVTSCSYIPTYAYGTCNASTPGGSTGTKTGTLSKCQRSDSKDITTDNAAKNYDRCAQTDVQNCTPTYTATFSATYGACQPVSGTPTQGFQYKTLTGCKNEAGTTVPVAACTGQEDKQACTPSYVATYTYGTCTAVSAGSTSGNRAATVATCKTSDGVTAPLSSCSAGTAQSCTLTYSAVFSATGGTCINHSQTKSIASCTAVGSDGSRTVVANSQCGAQTTTGYCESTCGPMQSGSISGTGAGQTKFVNFKASSAADALAQCKAMTSPDSTFGFMKYCNYYTGNGNSVAYFTKTPTSDVGTTFGSDSSFNYATCTG